MGSHPSGAMAWAPPSNGVPAGPAHLPGQFTPQENVRPRTESRFSSATVGFGESTEGPRLVKLSTPVFHQSLPVKDIAEFQRQTMADPWIKLSVSLIIVVA